MTDKVRKARTRRKSSARPRGGQARWRFTNTTRTTGACPRFMTCFLNHGRARSSAIAAPAAESGKEPEFTYDWIYRK